MCSITLCILKDKNMSFKIKNYILHIHEVHKQEMWYWG